MDGIEGWHLQLEDRQKEDFLASLSGNENIEVLSENNNEVRLLGIKFFSNESHKKKAFRDDFKEKLLQF